MENIIEIKRVSKSFGEKTIFENLDLSIKEGECLVVVGPSGCGKTTLLKLIAGLLFPDKGEIIVLGKNISDLDPFELNKMRANLGMVFQTSALFDSLTVKENVEFFLREHANLSGGETRKRVERILERVGLARTEDLFPSQLSEGMKKRVAIARALIYSPQILLYDEPTVGLDLVSLNNIIELIKYAHKDEGTTSIIVSHDLRNILSLGQRFILLKEGKIKELDNSWKDRVLQSLDIFPELFNTEVKDEKKKIQD